MGSGTGRKALFVNLYHFLMPIPPDLLHTLALAATVIIHYTIVVLLIRSMLNADRPSAVGKDDDSYAAMFNSKTDSALKTIAGEQH